jgi:alpha-1,3-rhamnosyl/mannosyltransferase
LAFVYPSRYEGFGLPLLEAMACGTAVIAADTPALVEVAGTAASYFEADDLGGLTALLTQIISDPHHRQNQQTRALARAQNFNWADTAAQTLEVCREVYGRA